MVPFPFRLLVSAVSLLVPRPKRREWRQEWEAELGHRAETGASTKELFRCARGVFRDAAWLRQNERKLHGTDLFRKPLRVEASFLAAGVLACLVAGAFGPPHKPYTESDRLVAFERNVAFAAAINQQINPKLLAVSKQEHLFTDIAGFRLLRQPAASARVFRNFFDVLGSTPLLGRTFRPNDPDDYIVVSYDFWRSQFRSDPNIAGQRKMIRGFEFTVIGVMPRDFWFLTSRLQFFAPIGWGTRPGGAVARLKPGAGVAATQTELRRLARTMDPRWFADSFALVPLLEDDRRPNLMFVLEVALLAALLGTGFVIVKGIGKLRYRLYLGARIFLTVGGLCLFRMSLTAHSKNGPMSHSLFVFWMFLLLCCAATFLLIFDHRQRCPVCLRRLRKPVAIGSYASQILDQPATEYLCPAGHGTLYVAETGNAPDHWTVLDESWQDLFAHTEE